MRKKIAVTAIIAIAAVVATLLVAQPILSQEDTAPADIMGDADINAILSEILAEQGEVSLDAILSEILAGQGEVSSGMNGQVLEEVSSAINGVDAGQAALDVTAANPWVSNTIGGTAVTTVKVSGYAGENMYWMDYRADKANMQLDFIILYVGNGKSPIQYEWQHFDFNKLYPGTGYGGGTSTPFGVVSWGGSPTIGPAYLVVLADGVYKGNYAFNVVN